MCLRLERVESLGAALCSPRVPWCSPRVHAAGEGERDRYLCVSALGERVESLGGRWLEVARCCVGGVIVNETAKVGGSALGENV